MSDGESPWKRPKLTHGDGPYRNPKAGPSKVQVQPEPQPELQPQPQSKIFKLDIDCFDEIFEYLSLKDLHSFGQTCKTMQKVSGEYFKRYYSAAETHIKNGGIDTVYSDYKRSINRRTSTTAFSQFITNITHRSYALQPLRYIRRHFGEFDSIRRVCFKNLDFDEEKGEELQRIWPNVETVHLIGCSICEDLHEIFLRHCKNNLKRLCVQSAKWPAFDPYVRVPWFHREYPMLEHLELIPIPPMVELNLLFQKNRNVKSFSTSGFDFWRNKNEFMQLNVQLDLLQIKASYVSVKEMSSVLWELYERGFFKRLHHCTNTVDEESSIELNLMPALEKLCIERFTVTFDLARLIKLRELVILDGANATDMDILANNLINLQRVYIGKATIEDILPFIRRSPELTKLKVIPRNEAHFNRGVLKLVTFNKEREKLVGARKVTIYVPDNIFLKTKWTTKHGDTNLKFVEMQRSGSYEWNQICY
ncbi:uncharacterized protein LOC129568844 isoform X2 [Sitodiplosis mosellana]|nr:uncharacterized protein LOC129568844 isoform X2 [Sitodiplosis mosellana]